MNKYIIPFKGFDEENPKEEGKASKISVRDPKQFDSQKKSFKGETLSDMKRKVKDHIPTYNQNEINNPQAVVEYADDIHNLLLKQERDNWSY